MLQGKILVTGGAGYIGSHTVVQLLDAGHQVAIFDNFSNSRRDVIERIKRITNKDVDCIEGDIRNRDHLRHAFQIHQFTAVVHLAGSKAISESKSEPLKYYDNNVSGSVALLTEMAAAGVETILFSSSATVYGDPGYVRYGEDTPLAPLNAYGRTKLMVEDVLRDLKTSRPSWRIALLRYFNPVGAHQSGLLGEDPAGVPNNLMPYIAQVAIGKRPKLPIFGNDYPTPDGTCLRDYIHVDDLAAGHLAALRKLSSDPTMITVNLGTGRPYSVIEMVKAFEKACGTRINYECVERRPGDLGEYYADPSLAKQILGWESKFGIERMCADTWRWQCNNPNG